MMRSLLAAAAVLMIVSASCSTSSSYTRTCYEVPDTIAEVRGDTTALETGLEYIEQFVGTGTEAVECTNVSVRYTGELLDGSRFDEGSFVFVPGAGMVIRGFEQGVVGMREEGVRRVIIPPELGYGSTTQYDRSTGEVLIPANSTLVFDIEVLEVVE